MYGLSNSWANEVLVFGPFKLFAAQRLLKKDDVSLPLGSRALDILKALLERFRRSRHS
jgi:DNA-binding winged helix-turn-helix (wHTH) protein